MSDLNHDVLVFSEIAESALPDMSPRQRSNMLCRKECSLDALNQEVVELDVTEGPHPESGFVRILVHCTLQLLYSAQGPGAMADIHRHTRIRIDMRESEFWQFSQQGNFADALYRCIADIGASAVLSPWASCHHHDFDIPEVQHVFFYSERSATKSARQRRQPSRPGRSHRAPKQFDLKGAPRLDGHTYSWMARALPGHVVEGLATASSPENGIGIVWTPETRCEHVRLHAARAQRFQGWTSLQNPSVATNAEPVYLRVGNELVSVGKNWPVLLADLLTVIFEQHGHNRRRLGRIFDTVFKDDWHSSVSHTLRKPTRIYGWFFGNNMNAAWYATCIRDLCDEFQLGDAYVALARHD